MSETISRSSPHTGTVLPEGRPFWIVDGKAYDLTDWMALHPGGATWFKTTQGRDISALLHTYHRDPLKLRKILARYEIDGFTERDVLPKMGIPPFLLAPDFDASVDLPRLDYRDSGSLLASVRSQVNAKLPKAALRRYDRLFDVVTWTIGLVHLAALGLMVTGTLAWWVCVLLMVVTRTALAGAGHYHLHRKWNDRGRFTIPIGKALFDINYVGTSLIGTDGHVLLHHPYLGSGADVKKTFFDRMLRLHPVLRIPGYTLHKFGICLLGLPLRAREIGKFEHPRTRPAQDGGLRGLIGFLRGGRRSSSSESAGSTGSTGSAPARKPGEAIRADFWSIRLWMVIEFALCAATGYIVPWIIQFVLTLWFNTFLVVASHDFEEAAGDDELDVIPAPLRDDWAARQICLSYDLSIVGNRWIDLWLSAGLSPHRVHHVLPFQGSGFANLMSESAVREACAEAGIAWERPRNLLFNRFPIVIKHYLLAPVMAGPPPGMGGPGGPPPGPMPGGPPPAGAPSLGPPPTGTHPGGPPPPAGARPGGPPPLGGPPMDGPPPFGGPPPLDGPPFGGPPPLGPPPPGAPPFGAGGPPPGLPRPPAEKPRITVGGQLAELVRYSIDGWRGIGV
ncbi:MAG TPA: cytochrome b5 domain-containing protein [Streptosporangiaceae bacterium]|nr:cytochrome b5 domain-containing protein [Streptosporangiaceae bacterium]